MENRELIRQLTYPEHAIWPLYLNDVYFNLMLGKYDEQDQCNRTVHVTNKSGTCNIANLFKTF